MPSIYSMNVVVDDLFKSWSSDFDTFPLKCETALASMPSIFLFPKRSTETRFPENKSSFGGNNWSWKIIKRFILNIKDDAPLSQDKIALITHSITNTIYILVKSSYYVMNVNKLSKLMQFKSLIPISTLVV